MTFRAQLFTVAVALIGLLGILFLVRRGRLKERFALLWLAIGAGMVGLVALRPLLDRLAEALGIASGTTLLFLFAILFLLGLLLHLSVTYSSLEEKVRTLTEEVALQRADSLEAGAPIEEPDEGHDEPDPA
jgi:hypothetical protein